jgi:hypothetical protein
MAVAARTIRCGIFPVYRREAPAPPVGLPQSRSDAILTTSIADQRLTRTHAGCLTKGQLPTIRRMAAITNRRKLTRS